MAPEPLDDRIASRDAFLRLCGFRDYTHYLTSDLWALIRQSLIGYPWAAECGACGSRVGLQWHHRDYSPATLIGNIVAPSRLEDTAGGFDGPIVRLCSACHGRVHFDESGQWIADMNRVERRLLAIPRELIEREQTGRKPFTEGWDAEPTGYDGFD